MQNYKIEYLPIYYEDLERIVDYISDELDNPKAAMNLIDKIEAAIMNRKDFAESFEPYRTKVKVQNKYYRIYVDNYVVLYVVIPRKNGERIMEVRRLLYCRQQLPKK